MLSRQLVIDLVCTPPRPSQLVPHEGRSGFWRGSQPVRFATKCPGQVIEAPAERYLAARATALGRTRHVRLSFVRAQFATFGLEKAHVDGEAPGVRPLARFGAMD